MQARAYTSPAVVRCREHRLRPIPGKLRVVWDGAPIHRGRPVKDFLAPGGAERIRPGPFPAHAPDLNPAEGIRHSLEHVEVRTLCGQTLDHLRRHLRPATARLRHKRPVIQACAHQCGYHV